MLRVAVIGAGGYAFYVIQRIWEMPDKIEIVAVTSNPARKTPGADACRNRGIQVFGVIDELLENVKGKCDVIYVPTPIHTHGPLMKKCLGAGFDVWIEKPPAGTIQEHDDMIACANKFGKTVAVGFQYLYGRLMQEMKANISDGRYGKVRRVRSIGAWERFDSYYARNDWGGKLRVGEDWILDGTINNPMAHVLSNDLYLASMDRWQMGEPATVQAELYHAHDIEGEDTSSLRIVTTDGVEVTFQGTLCADKPQEPVTVVDCEKATIEFSEFKTVTVTYKDGRKEQAVDGRERTIVMLERLVSDYLNHRIYPASLERCRPFTLAVNAAFESSEFTHAIDAKYIRRGEKDGQIKTTVERLDELMRQAWQQGKLLSDLGAPWAVRIKPFRTGSYVHFPSPDLARNY
jgi:predicted dehydrogenase